MANRSEFLFEALILELQSSNIANASLKL